MNRYLVCAKKSIANGHNIMWIEQEIKATKYLVDDNEQLHLYDERERAVSFSRGNWQRIEKICDRNQCCEES